MTSHLKTDKSIPPRNNLVPFCHNLLSQPEILYVTLFGCIPLVVGHQLLYSSCPASSSQEEETSFSDQKGPVHLLDLGTAL